MSGYDRRLQRHQATFASSESSEAAELEIPCLGTIPFDPSGSLPVTAIGIPLAAPRETPVGLALAQFAQRLLDVLGQSRPGRKGASTMKFLCVPCAHQMKLQSVGPPSAARCRSSTRVLRCGYEITNAYETQVVQSLGGVRIGPGLDAAGAGAAPWAIIPGTDGCSPANRFPFAGRPPQKPWLASVPSSRFHGTNGLRNSPAKRERWRLTKRSSTEPASLGTCNSSGDVMPHSTTNPAT